MKALNSRWVAIIVFTAAVLKLAVMYLDLWSHFQTGDFPVYYTSGWVLRHGANPYTTDLRVLSVAAGIPMVLSHATDPPTFLMLVAPLTRYSVHTCYWIWQGINLAAFVVGIWLLLSPRFSGLPKWTAVALAGFALMFPPAGNCLVIAQNKVMVLCLLAAMWRFLERDRAMGAGMCLALASMLRVFPALVFFYLLIQRRWKAAIWTCVFGIVIAAITLYGVGLDVMLSFRQGISTLTIPGFIDQASNISLNGILSRILWSADFSDFSRHLVTAAADLVVFAIVARASFRNDQDGRIFALWPIAAVLISPTAWFHYMVLALIPIAFVFSSWNNHKLADSTPIKWEVIGYLATAVVGVFLTQNTPAYGLYSALNLEFLVLAVLFWSGYVFATAI